MEKKRSVGITVIGKTIIFYGILRMVLTILNIFIGILGVRFRCIGNTSHLYNLMFLGALVSLIFSLCYIISGLGILKLKKWGYISVISFLFLKVIFDIFCKFVSIKYSHTENFVNLGLFRQGLNSLDLSSPFSPFYLLILLFNVTIFVFLIYFFTRPKVREQFK